MTKLRFRNACQSVMQCDVKLKTVGRANALQKLCSTPDMATIAEIRFWKFYPPLCRGNRTRDRLKNSIRILPFLISRIVPDTTTSSWNKQIINFMKEMLAIFIPFKSLSCKFTQNIDVITSFPLFSPAFFIYLTFVDVCKIL